MGQPIAYAAFRNEMDSDRKACNHANCGDGKERHMLWTIAVVLTVLWLLGLVSSYTMGGFIHILVVVAVVMVLVNIISGRRG
jgi:hypothetical protein